MLVNLNEILAVAEERKCAVGAFNTPNLECVSAVLSAAERLNEPVILSHAQLHEEIAPLEVIGPVMVLLAERSSVPVCVHLDHCETLSYMKRALELGFTGVMYDGSTLPYEENVENTKKAAEMIRGYSCGLEAEIG
ncbi:MAG: class II fructose-bisphosphate aldolase, partial [Lachnospiraceae bacterium]|nr:class II fructose-bisphosphate aldolase [Lachnospiraceae bacterium]